MKQLIVLILIATSMTSFKPTTKMTSIAVKSGNIKVKINGIESKKGQIVFMLFNKDEGFPSATNKAYKTGIVTTFDGTASYTFKDIPYGTYAIAVFHDENADGAIQKNFIGMPKEPVGASNLTKMSKPSFKKCAVELNASELKLDMVFII